MAVREAVMQISRHTAKRLTNDIIAPRPFAPLTVVLVTIKRNIISDWMWK